MSLRVALRIALFTFTIIVVRNTVGLSSFGFSFRHLLFLRKSSLESLPLLQEFGDAVIWHSIKPFGLSNQIAYNLPRSSTLDISFGFVVVASVLHTTSRKLSLSWNPIFLCQAGLCNCLFASLLCGLPYFELHRCSIGTSSVNYLYL